MSQFLHGLSDHLCAGRPAQTSPTDSPTDHPTRPQALWMLLQISHLSLEIYFCLCSLSLPPPQFSNQKQGHYPGHLPPHHHTASSEPARPTHSTAFPFLEPSHFLIPPPPQECSLIISPLTHLNLCPSGLCQSAYCGLALCCVLRLNVEQEPSRQGGCRKPTSNRAPSLLRPLAGLPITPGFKCKLPIQVFTFLRPLPPSASIQAGHLPVCTTQADPNKLLAILPNTPAQRSPPP